MKQSAGTLLYRNGVAGLEVLIVHPSGNYNAKAPWSIPKGEWVKGEESPEKAARRETEEECGIIPPEKLYQLGDPVKATKQKTITAYAGEVEVDTTARIASWEIDRAEFVSIDTAEQLLHPGQRIFLDRLRSALQP